MKIRFLSLLVPLLAAAACGGSEQPGQGGAGTVSGTSASGGSGASGAGGAGGAAGTAGSVGTGGSAPGAGDTGSVAMDSGAGAGGTASTATCPDMCPAPSGGIMVGCQKRFHYGVNWAWASFGSDFGSSANGVAARRAQRLVTLQDMQANGVDVIRWWIFPNFTGGGVNFDDAGTPTGLGGTVAADVAAALDLAAQAGVHIEFTLFSFDSFKTTLARNLAPIIQDPGMLAALESNVVTAFANEVSKSANRDRVVSWDIINEPEWAISGDDGVDQAFTPQTTVTTVTYPTMKSFVVATAAALHAASDRPVTVGGAAIKWAKAWAGIGDFYSFHMYDWINMSFPYDRPLAQYGVTDKPVVLGEFPVQGLTGVPYATLVGTIFNLGYAGAMAWAVNDRNFPWAPNKPGVKAFADQTGCAVRY